jgi:hypothetical protein
MNQHQRLLARERSVDQLLMKTLDQPLTSYQWSVLQLNYRQQKARLARESYSFGLYEFFNKKDGTP